MKIDSIDFGDRPLFLAPMEGVTDAAFRPMAKNFGADLVYTEFLSADALIRNVSSTYKKMTISPEERPVAVQIYGKDLSSMIEASIRVASYSPDILDLNFGCPVKRVAGKGAGSGMLRTPELLIQISKEIVKHIDIPVTVKTRLGWDHQSIIIEDLAEQLQDVGIKALTIHGRTRSDMYTGRANWEYIGRVKKNPRIKIPIIGNGDIITPYDAQKAFELYGVDAIMIGRGAIGQPWIFQDIKNYFQNGEINSSINFEEAISLLKTLILENIRMLDEYKGILHSRQHIAQSPIFKGIPNFRNMRIAMLQAKTAKELFELLDFILGNPAMRANH